MELPVEFLQGSLECTCGRQHSVPIDRIVVGNDVVHELSEYLAEKRYLKLLLVADSTTYDVFGCSVRAKLMETGLDVGTCVLSQEHELLPDAASVEQVLSAMSQHSYHAVIAVGSGVINDVVRYTSFQRELPYVSIPTAPSMDGYASKMAAMQFSGLKVTTKAHTPCAIFAELSVLSNSPFELIQAGVGDLVGKAVSLLDWTLAKNLYGEYFCDKIYDLVYEPLSYVVDNADKIYQRDEDSVKNLYIGLINSGIAMAMMGNSRPCSGSEHHCSHFWDYAAFQGRRAHTSHGLQVGYATHWMTEIYRRAVSLKTIEPPRSSDVSGEFVQYVNNFYGSMAEEVIAADAEKRRWLNNYEQNFQASIWEARFDFLGPGHAMLDKAEQALLSMGIKKEVGFLEISRELLRETLLHARELRARYTILDFLDSQGVLQTVVDDLMGSKVVNK